MIIAVDFDGVLVKDRFPEIGDPEWDILKRIWMLKNTDHELILWTSRVDDRLAEAVKWCEDHDLKFVAINDNAPSNLAEYGTNPRKIYADRYIDDRAVGYSKTSVVRFLDGLLKDGGIK